MASANYETKCKSSQTTANFEDFFLSATCKVIFIKSWHGKTYLCLRSLIHVLLLIRTVQGVSCQLNDYIINAILRKILSCRLKCIVIMLIIVIAPLYFGTKTKNSLSTIFNYTYVLSFIQRKCQADLTIWWSEIRLDSVYVLNSRQLVPSLVVVSFI